MATVSAPRPRVNRAPSRRAESASPLYAEIAPKVVKLHLAITYGPTARYPKGDATVIRASSRRRDVVRIVRMYNSLKANIRGQRRASVTTILLGLGAVSPAWFRRNGKPYFTGA